MGKHKTPRQAIIAQCKYGDDDDLIDWYLSIEKGNRQSEVKRILRRGLGLPEKQSDSIYGQLTPDDIETLVSQRIEERLESELNAIQKTFDEMWAATQREIKGAIHSMDYAPPGSGMYEPIEVEKVDEETLAARRANMQKDEW